MYPNEPVNLGDAVQVLPADHSVPELPDWKWLHTPGHSPGHVSYFREADRVLIAGDAFITVRQDSFYNVLFQNEEINGPPRYLTTDWEAAKQSAEQLLALNPEMAVTGHGVAVHGERLKSGLEKLVKDFDHIAVPDYGRFVDQNKYQ